MHMNTYKTQADTLTYIKNGSSVANTDTCEPNITQHNLTILHIEYNKYS